MTFPGEGDYRLEPPRPDECPCHPGHEDGACERCDWDAIALALDEALDAFDTLKPCALPARDEDRDLPIAAE